MKHYFKIIVPVLMLLLRAPLWQVQALHTSDKLTERELIRITCNTAGSCFNSNYRFRRRLHHSTQSDVLRHGSCVCSAKRLWYALVQCDVRGQIYLSAWPKLVPNLHTSKSVWWLTWLVARFQRRRSEVEPVTGYMGLKRTKWHWGRSSPSTSFSPVSH
jgi:hypothetical protein